MQNTYFNISSSKLGQLFPQMNILVFENNATYLSNMMW